jgi:DNA repair protein RadD
MKLRKYQEEAVESILWHSKDKTKDIVCLPTGSGKSLVIAETAHRVQGKVLIVSPSREITIQNKQKMAMYVDEEEIGIYSASFNKKEVRTYTFATIQSVWKHSELFKEFSYVFIDECHRSEDSNIFSMFGTFLNNLDVKVVGFTATPFRMWRSDPDFQGDLIITYEEVRLLTHKSFNWDRIIYKKDYKDLLEEGYLSPLKYHKTGKVASYELIEKYNHIPKIIFAESIKDAKRLLDKFPTSAYVDAKTKKKDREEIIEKFNQGTITTLINYNALTTGFDAPNIQMIFLYRDFKSTSEYLQAIGRGTRLAPNKKTCLVVDTKRNIKTHGYMQDITLKKIDSFLPDEAPEWWLSRNGKQIDRVKIKSVIKNPKRY